MTTVNNQSQVLKQLFNHAISARQEEMNNLVYESTRGVVQSGPFRGLTMLRHSSWGAGEFSPKLLGCYEAELIPFVVEAIAKKFPQVINVGCAEGYYAVGLARRMPESRIIAYDISEAAQAVCQANAKVNRTADRVEVRGTCTHETLAKDLAGGVPTFLVMDCEGAEMHLLDPEKVPLEHCDILLECHDLFNPAITPTLIRRLEATHAIERIEEGPRNPNSPILNKQDSVNRWLAVCEFRMGPQHWLMFRAKAQKWD